MLEKDGILVKVEQQDIENDTLVISTDIHTIGPGAIKDDVKIKTLICHNNIAFNYHCINNHWLKHIVIAVPNKDAENRVEINKSAFTGLTKIVRISFHNEYNWRNPKINDWIYSACPIIIEDAEGDHRVYNAGNTLVELTSHFTIVDIYDVAKCKLVNSSEEESNFLFLATKMRIAGIGIGVKQAIKSCRANYITAKNLRAKYQDITTESLLTPLQYQEITGACKSGVDSWVKEHTETLEHLGGQLQVQYLLDHLKGQPSYQDFVQFVMNQYEERVANSFQKKINSIGGLTDERT